MRKFRNDKTNLRDTRIVYTFLLSLALLCTIMAVVLTQLNKRAASGTLAEYYRTLSSCSDALRSWELAERAQDQYTASLRFRSAVAQLPEEVVLEPLLELADSMESGSADPARVRAMAETFCVLCAAGYSEPSDAASGIADAVNGVSGAVLSEQSAQPVSLMPEVLSYTYKVTKNSVRHIFDGNSGQMKPKLSADGGTWDVVADNVRMSFDAQTGGLEAFVFLRLGAVPHKRANEEECLDAVKQFYCTNRRRSDNVTVQVVDRLGGFLCADVMDGDDVYRVNVDSHARVWSLVKVKR